MSREWRDPEGFESNALDPSLHFFICFIYLCIGIVICVYERVCVCVCCWVVGGGGVRRVGAEGWGVCRHQDGAIEVAVTVAQFVFWSVLPRFLFGCFGRAGGELRAASCQQSAGGH